jgi:hypothetical protein
VLNPKDNFKCVKAISISGFTDYNHILLLSNGNLAFTANETAKIPYIISRSHK